MILARRKTALFLSLMALGLTSLSYSSTNPQDPNNWTILPAVEVGSDRYQRLEFNPTSYVIEAATYIRQWSDPTRTWYRNDEPWTGERIMPFHKKVIAESDTLVAKSMGTVELRLEWKGLGGEASPSSVRVVVESTAQAGVSGTSAAGIVVENGLESPIQEWPDWLYGGTLFTADGRLSKRVPVENGIARVVLTKRAFSILALGAGESGYVLAHASGGTLAVDPRQVSIRLQGGQYEKLPELGPTNQVTVSIPWKSNPRHDVIITEEPVTFRYLQMRRVPVPIRYNGDDNEASYVVSPPVVKVNAPPPGHQFPPLPEYEWTFLGLATTEYRRELYQWTIKPEGIMGPGGELPRDGSWIIPPLTLWTQKDILWQHTSFSTKWVTADVLSLFQEVVLRYEWADGLVGHSTRNVTFSDPRVDDSRSPMVESVEDFRFGLEFEGGRFRIPAGTNEATAVLRPGWWDKRAASTVLGLAAATLGGLEVFQPYLSIPAGLAVAAGIAVEWVDNGEELFALRNRDYDPLYTFWYINGERQETEPAGFNVDDWAWDVSLRPTYYQQVVAYDQYGPNGFAGRFDDMTRGQQPKRQSRKFFTFYQYRDTGGSGGPTGGGSQ